MKALDGLASGGRIAQLPDPWPAGSLAISTVAFPDARRKDPSLALQRAAELGFSGCHFHTIFETHPQLSRTSMAGVGEQAGRQGQTLSAGVLFVAPTRPSRAPEILLAGGGDWTKGILAVLEAAAAAGMSDLLAVVGKPEDRTSDGSWQEQLQATVELLKTIRAQLKANGQRIILKNHPEISSRELERMVLDVGADVLAVGFDPINLVARGEDPLEVAAKLGDVIAQVYLDDMVMIRNGGDLIRVPVPVGSGIIEWERLMNCGPLRRSSPGWTLDLKRDPVRLRVQDQEWLAAQNISSTSVQYCQALADSSLDSSVPLGQREARVPVPPESRLEASLAGLRTYASAAAP